MSDPLAGATNGLKMPKSLRDESHRVAREVEMMINHLRRAPGVDLDAMEEGVVQLRQGFDHIVRAVSKGKSGE
jgi:hypothetical protein